REKFIIRDVTAADAESSVPLVALSNRIAIPLGKPGSDNTEHYVIRAQNMHSCARFAARLAQEYQDHGPLLTRARPFDWDGVWTSLIKGYEATWNPHRWVAVYHKGRIVYQSTPAREGGGRHPFLDIIEQCEAVNT